MFVFSVRHKKNAYSKCDCVKFLQKKNMGKKKTSNLNFAVDTSWNKGAIFYNRFYSWIYFSDSFVFLSFIGLRMKTHSFLRSHKASQKT